LHGRLRAEGISPERRFARLGARRVPPVQSCAVGRFVAQFDRPRWRADRFARLVLCAGDGLISNPAGARLMDANRFACGWQ
jgi:hypothetical protein